MGVMAPLIPRELGIEGKMEREHALWEKKKGEIGWRDGVKPRLCRHQSVSGMTANPDSTIRRGN